MHDHSVLGKVVSHSVYLSILILGLLVREVVNPVTDPAYPATWIPDPFDVYAMKTGYGTCQ